MFIILKYLFKNQKEDILTLPTVNSEYCTELSVFAFCETF